MDVRCLQSHKFLKMRVLFAYIALYGILLLSFVASVCYSVSLSVTTVIKNGLCQLADKNSMMTSSNGNIFRVTGPLCGEFTGHRWIPRTKASDTYFLVFSLICAWINGWVNTREAGDLRRHRAHCDVIVNSECQKASMPIQLSCGRHDTCTHHAHINHLKYSSALRNFRKTLRVYWLHILPNVVPISLYNTISNEMI